MPPPPSTFGKRNAPRPPVGREAPSPTSAAVAPDHAAFFARLRAETVDEDSRPLAVPRSFRAALLAGLVVGCCLAGLDATQADATLRRIAGLVPGGAPRLLPVVILLGLFGGARAAATNLLLSHWVLRRLGWTSHVAYAAFGGAVAALIALLTEGVLQSGLMQSSLSQGHGFGVEIATGAGAGFFYRVFAGAARA